MIRALFELEARLFLRSVTSVCLVVLVAVMTVAALGVGEMDRARKSAIQTAFIQAAAEQEAVFREALLQAERGEEASPFHARPMLISSAAILPDGVLGDFSIGAGALFPDRVDVRLWNTSASLFQNYQFENPTLLRFGRLDLTVVIVLIMPLLMIAMSFDVLATDRQTGRLRMLLTAGASERAILWTGLAFRNTALWTPLIVISALAMIVNAAPGEFASRFAHYLMWLAGIIAYGLFWAFAIGLVAMRSSMAGQTGARLIALWAILVLIIPAVATAVLQTVYPTPSRLAYLSEVRAATAQAEEATEGWLEGYALANPEIQTETEGNQAPFRDGYLRTALVEERTAPLVAAFDEAGRKRRKAQAWLQLLSPAMATNSYLSMLGGGDAERYMNFQRLARQHLTDSVERLGPAILSGRRISVEEYDNLPRLAAEVYNTRAVSWGLIRRLLIVTGFVILAFAAAFVTFPRKGRASA